MTDLSFSENAVRSYVPELDFLGLKDARGCRLCREDVAVLDASNGFRTVAFRGSVMLDGEAFLSSVGLSGEERSFLEDSLGRASRVLLHSPAGPLLVFADLIRETGLLIAVRPHSPSKEKRGLRSESLVRALHLLGREDFLISPAASRSASRAHSEDLSLCQALEELLYYMDGLCPDRLLPFGLAPSVLRLANFAGCDPRRIRFPDALPDLTPIQGAHLLLFLLCSFLTLRQRSGELILGEGQENAAAFSCTVRLLPLENSFFDREASSLTPSLRSRMLLRMVPENRNTSCSI